MLKHADNELLTRVGPGTPMGQTLRHYWWPICTSADLPETDGDPIRVRLLGESFVAFRDSGGQVGVLAEACPHRGASLVLGRNEDNGVRCLWHGWKFAADGSVQDMPNVADSARLRQRLRARALPVHEAGGLIWVHYGPESTRTSPPDYHWMRLPEAHRLIVPVDLDCNYLQPMEGLADSSHVGMLHQDILRGADLADAATLTEVAAPVLEVESTDFGMHYAALRGTDASGRQVRVTSFVTPNLFYIPPDGAAFLTVPLDDTHSRFYNILFSEEDALVDTAAGAQQLRFFGLTDHQIDAAGLRAKRSWPTEGECWNRFNQDRAGMRTGRTFTGLDGLTAEDAAMTSSMGAIYDRTLEHLVPADQAVIRMRRILLESARRVAAGEAPIGTHPTTDVTSIRARSGILQPGEDWHELVDFHCVVDRSRPSLAEA